MKITIIAHPNSKNERIEKLDERYYELFFNVVPEKGRANQKIIEMVSEYFDFPKSKIRFYSGKKSRLKILEVG